MKYDNADIDNFTISEIVRWSFNGKFLIADYVFCLPKELGIAHH